MRYIYYIIGIFFLATVAVGVMNRDKTSIDVSKPAIVINDRIITENEFETLLNLKPHDMTNDEYIDSLIMNVLLIQEALARGINREESFRHSVEKFYERSLVKSLLDRKSGEFEARVTDTEVDAYMQLCRKAVVISKATYCCMEAVGENRGAKVEMIEQPFVFLSDNLRFTVLNLDIGESCKPIETPEGVVVYTLNALRESPDIIGLPVEDETRVKRFITNQKINEQYEQWTDELKQQADIWRRK